ncbi:MAG: hypothetical protein COU71_02245 [Parcubacteria group bacterium CG10_big_fil_rev_8_21_14_0_10_38_31]|nr:MAG: hypothetical protein COU71_02245 [Parcubacteria group bacterium CG10_big_fil_rev_8_21_14_0_10_38_31]
MDKINKNYIYIAVVVLIAGGLYFVKSRDKDMALEVIDDNLPSEEVVDSNLTASLISSAPKKMMTLKIYFPNATMAKENKDACQEVFPVNRSVVETIAPARVSLLELFKGPSNEEKELGFETAISPNIEIQKLTIADKIATVDVNVLTDEDNNPCKTDSARKEIEETLKQFLTVENVHLSIDGVMEKETTE